MEYRKRRKKKKNDVTQKLIGLIVILVVVLVAVVSIALTMDPGGNGPSMGGSNTQPSDPTQGTQNTDPTIMPTDPAIDPLTVTYPQQSVMTTLEDTVRITGTADPSMAVTINGTQVYALQDGSFKYDLKLQHGDNVIEITYDGQTVTYHVDYRYATQAVFPAEDTQYGCGATMQISAWVRSGSTLEVTFNGKTVKMKKSKDQLISGSAEGFLLYTGTYQMPTTSSADTDMGVVQYKVVCNGIVETYTSGTITCLKSPQVLSSDPSVTPDSDPYMDVGSGYIVEILTNSAESFDGRGTIDTSKPTMNYLPKGTVDYGYSVDINNEASLVRLRCGRSVYLKQIKNYPPASNKTSVVDCYKGTLPDHNEVGFASVEQVDGHTLLTFDVMWKAPFFFDLLPQKYSSPNNNDYAVTACTATYVDITFCYATVFEGEVNIPLGNPLFSHAELIQNEDDCTLRLYLKKTGGFYGWDAYYNENDQLCFVFLNPAKVTTTTANKYGADLTGVRVMIDVGHGGDDGGAVRSGSSADEAAVNLQLALKLKAELESMGATVIMNRTTDVNVTVQERVGFLKQQKPDICIAIHQNSGESASYNGGWICYYSPYSMALGQLIYNETVNAGIYNKTQFRWDTSKYYVGRETVCPVILMENGFMSNDADWNTIIDENIQWQKAYAMAQGIANYFLTISRNSQ